MPVLLFGLLGLALLQWAALDLKIAQGDVGRHEVMAAAQREVAQYRSFLFGASRVLSAQPITGSAVQTRTWADLVATSHMPLHLKSAQMPANWIVRGNDTGWVVCARLSDAAARLMQASLPATDPITSSSLSGFVADAGRGIKHVQRAGKDYWVMGNDAEATQDTYLNWCSVVP